MKTVILLFFMSAFCLADIDAPLADQPRTASSEFMRGARIARLGEVKNPESREVEAQKIELQILINGNPSDALVAGFYSARMAALESSASDDVMVQVTIMELSARLSQRGKAAGFSREDAKTLWKRSGLEWGKGADGAFNE